MREKATAKLYNQTDLYKRLGSSGLEGKTGRHLGALVASAGWHNYPLLFMGMSPIDDLLLQNPEAPEQRMVPAIESPAIKL